MNLIYSVLSIGILLTQGRLAVAADSPAPQRIKIATILPKGSSAHQALLEMGAKWREAPGGSVAMTIYTDGTMGGEAETVRRMRVGQLQGAVLSVAGLREIDRSATALQTMPMVFRSLEEVAYVRDKLRPMLDKRLEEKGFICLFLADGGWVRFFSKKLVLHPGDLKSQKLFVLSSDPEQIDLVKTIGYQAVPLEYTDTLTGLQTGLIDAVPTTPFYALAGQFYQPAPHLLELNYVPLTGGLVMTRKAWDSLPQETRDAMRDAAAITGKQISAQSRQEMEEATAAMVKRGLKVNRVDASVEAEWRALFESIYPQIRGRLVPADLFDEVQRLLKEYRK
jgi:TRAP-type C4-dicarboxylate transport system substrate-binding protein